MFEARLSSTLTLKKIVDALRDILNQSTLDCSDMGIQLQAMDNSHVSLVCLCLRSDYFEKYKCSRNVSLGLDLKSLTKVLKCANGDDAVTIKAADKADKIELSFESVGKERTADYELRLLNLDQEHLAIPETEYSCVIHMPAAEFARICRDLAVFSESVVIACSKNGIKFSANGEMGSANIKLSETSKGEVTLQVDEPVTLSFAGRYLNTFTRATPLAEKVKIGMAADVPLLVEYPIEDYGYIRYYLAPKVDDPDS
ncbi:PREDICTED: proliferating cell nuclear antigen [Drosophila arizonae]|uniref:DNA sliding clamp PCNA n=1 Tax=Drosophila arizonae TaxID=7263 RepID=A0ABM1NPP3_DROAR|nr:PREDICTED: proliferating cell nuclear antigen [Drosophila arizonae]